MKFLSVTPDNFEIVSQINGKPIEELREQYLEDQRRNQVTMIVASEYRIRLRSDSCFYNHKYKAERTSWVCALHNQESKYEIEEGSRFPCLAVDPYP